MLVPLADTGWARSNPTLTPVVRADLTIRHGHEKAPEPDSHAVWEGSSQNGSDFRWVLHCLYPRINRWLTNFILFGAAIHGSSLLKPPIDLGLLAVIHVGSFSVQ